MQFSTSATVLTILATIAVGVKAAPVPAPVPVPIQQQENPPWDYVISTGNLPPIVSTSVKA